MTGAELAAIRKAAGLTQAQLAQRAGFERRTVLYWEHKPFLDPRSAAVRRFAEILGVSYLLGSFRARVVWGLTIQREQEQLQARIAAMRAKWAAGAGRRVRCEAMTRKGTPCENMSEPGKRRCKFHGGMSTGPKTTEGIARIREAQRARWARWREAYGQGED